MKSQSRANKILSAMQKQWKNHEWQKRGDCGVVPLNAGTKAYLKQQKGILRMMHR